MGLLASVPALAQKITGDISGTVTDPSGAAVRRPALDLIAVAPRPQLWQGGVPVADEVVAPERQHRGLDRLAVRPGQVNAARHLPAGVVSVGHHE